MPPRRACDVCAKRKIQCSLRDTGPPCDWCSNQGIECTSLREPQKKRSESVSVDTVRSLSRRIEQLEGELARRSSDSPTPFSHSPASAVTFDSSIRNERHSVSLFTSPHTASGVSVEHEGTPPAASPLNARAFNGTTSSWTSPLGHHLGKNWYFKGKHILSESGRTWISASTGQSDPLEKFRLLNTPAGAAASGATLRRHRYVPEDHFSTLPEETQVRQLFETFCASPASSSLSIPSPSAFHSQVSEAYSREGDLQTWSRCSARAFVWASLAFFSSFKCVRHTSPPIDGEYCASMAASVLAVLVASPTIESLQSILMLQTYWMFSGQWQRVDSLHSLSCRVLCQLGGHLPGSAVDGVPARDCIRALFWILFTLDKDISLRSGQPPYLPSDYCAVQEGIGRVSVHTSTAIGMVGRPPRDTRLAIFKEEVCKLLWSSNTRISTDTQILLSIRRADEQLETWRLSQPEDMRPRLSIPAGRPSPMAKMNQEERYGFLGLELEYHHLLSTIHSTVRRTGAAVADNENLAEDLHGVVHSSIDITLEAGRSTLACLKEVIELLEEESFHHVMAYGPLAMMSLFINVLVHPLDQRAHGDLETITSAVGDFQRMSLRWLSISELEQLKELNEFAMELVRLGQCAIWEAKRRSRWP